MQRTTMTSSTSSDPQFARSIEACVDQLFKKKIWKGANVLCCIRLASDEISDMTIPEPFYCLLSRYTYWPRI